VRLLAISGSLREGSHNTALLRTAAELAPDEVVVERYDALALLPPFSEDLEDHEPPAVRHWRDAIARADALLFSTPEYNASVPGQLKNAVDWASRPVGEAVLEGKPAAVIGASTSAYGALWAQAELRKILGAAGARVVEAELAVPRAQELRAGAGLKLAPSQRERLAGVIGSLVAAASRAPAVV